MLRKGEMRELAVRRAVATREINMEDMRLGALPSLGDHFTQRGPHGDHYCFVTEAFCYDVRSFRASAPTGRLGVHFVKPIISCVVDGLVVLHDNNIIHAGT